MEIEYKNQENSNYLKYIFIAGGILLLGIIFWFVAKRNNSISQINLGEQQRQKTNVAVLQLANNLLDNADNLNQLTRKSNGATKTIQEIEEEFLISAFNPNQSNNFINQSLPSEVIEKIWWELRPWIEEYLKDLNKSILEHAQEKFRRDVENWIKWQNRKYNRQTEEYWKRLQELKKIEDLIAEYQKIREKELLDKINRKKELIEKGYSDRDIEKLKEWDLLDQEIPDLNSESRIGATNILWTSEREWGKIGGSSDLIVFLKPKLGKNSRVESNIEQNNSEAVINFSTQIAYGDKEGYRKFVRDYLKEKGKNNYDAYCLIRTDSSMSGPSAGIAYYLAFYSLINQVSLPRNLGSTGTIFEKPKVGAIGGLNLKLEYNVKKEKPIDTYILSEENWNKESYQKSNNGRCLRESSSSYYDLISSHVKERVKQVHFVNNVLQIEIALQEILKEPSRKIVHSCEKVEAPRKEEPKPNLSSQISSKQLLSLSTELFLRDVPKNQKDFQRKLMSCCMSNETYQSKVEEALALRKEYIDKIEEDYLSTDEGIAKQIQELEKQIAEKEKTLNGNLTIEEEQNIRAEIKVFKRRLEELKKGGKSSNQRAELEKEYENKFQEIASLVTDLTTEMLTNLQKFGYTIQEIKWISELKAPSLTSEFSVSFSLKKNS